MAARVTNAALVVPISMLLLGVLRCWQFMEKHGVKISWTFSKSTDHSLSDPASYHCEHSYSVEILSIDPLVMYLNDFISDAEIRHLLKLGEDRFSPSKVTDGTSEHVNLTVRRSQTAFLPYNDHVCDCLTDRMKSLLGNVQHQDVEGLQLVKYASGGDGYRVHTDWSEIPNNTTLDSDGAVVRQSRRLGSIFVYLQDNCERGETFFPELVSVSESADGDKFALPDNDNGNGNGNDDKKGLLVKPRRGNAVFWNNLHANGSGDMRLQHAALPTESGVKIGLNMWSTYFFDSPMVGGKESVANFGLGAML